MKILFGILLVFTSIRYAKFQSSNLILEGIFIIFSMYTMRVLAYCRTKVFELHKFLTRMVVLSLGKKKSHTEQGQGNTEGGGAKQPFPASESLVQ